VGTKKAGLKSPRLITQLKYIFEPKLNLSWLNFPAAKQKELLLLFRSNFLFCDGFLNRFFRGSGLSGFFGHV
jgi:hypothetical protein